MIRLLLLLAVSIAGGCERTGPAPADADAAQTQVGSAQTSRDTGDLQAAAWRYRQILENDPAQADTHLALARVLEQLGDFAASAEHCDTALKQYPSDAGAWHLRGRLFERAGDDNAAVGAYEAALEYAPDTLPTRELLAGALMRLGRYDAARRQYAEGLTRADAVPARLLYRYGLALIASGRCTEAVDPLQRAYASDQTSAAIAEALIRVRSSCAAGAMQNSAGTLSLAAELFGARPDAAVAEALAMAHAASGNFDNAVLLQQRVVASDQGTAYSRELLTYFERSERAPRPWDSYAPAYHVPGLGDR